MPIKIAFMPGDFGDIRDDCITFLRGEPQGETAALGPPITASEPLSLNTIKSFGYRQKDLNETPKAIEIAFNKCLKGINVENILASHELATLIHYLSTNVIQTSDFDRGSHLSSPSLRIFIYRFATKIDILTITKNTWDQWAEAAARHITIRKIDLNEIANQQTATIVWVTLCAASGVSAISTGIAFLKNAFSMPQLGIGLIEGSLITITLICLVFAISSSQKRRVASVHHSKFRLLGIRDETPPTQDPTQSITV